MGRPLRVAGRATRTDEWQAAEERLSFPDYDYAVRTVGAVWATSSTRAGALPVDLAGADGKTDAANQLVAVRFGGGLVEYRRLKHADLEELGEQISRSRGVTDVLLELLELEPLEKLIAKVGAKGVLAFAQWLETKLVRGTVRLIDATNLADAMSPVRAVAQAQRQQPHLVFLHGTFSNPWGSFGKLASTPGWSTLQGEYGDRMLALHHRTVSDSPLDNARALVGALADGMTIDLCTHSRGGLVGELLARASVPPSGKEWDASDQLLELMMAHPTADTPPPDPAFLATWKNLVKEMRERSIRVRRFVRVACPAAGTSLAGPRLGKFLSILTSAIGWATGLGDNPVYRLAKAVTLETVRQGSTAGELPGLGAMVPGGPLVRLLSVQPRLSTGRTTVIRGTTVGSGIFGRAGMWAVDRFFQGPNDLVVNSPSMDGGLPRAGASLSVQRFESSRVNHFSYFKLPQPSSAIAKALVGTDTPTSRRGAQRARTTRRPVKGPVLFVLPGIGGSHLAVDDHKIWLSRLRLAFGGMSSLALDGGRAVTPVAVDRRFYGDLVDHLRNHFDVREFPYDWRVSLRQEARRLTVPVRQAVHQGRVVHFIAHSMGGLLSRALLLDTGLRDDLARRGSRVVMLGTPNDGSIDAFDLMSGASSTLAKLAVLDVKHDRQQLTKILGGFPGVADLLPSRFFDPGEWGPLKVRAPREELLTSSKGLRDEMGRALDAIKPMIRYVAGTSSKTRIDVDRTDKGRWRYRLGPGDGRVPYSTGIIDAAQTWYCEAVHGDLANHRQAFPAYVDLLLTGTTRRLATRPPDARRTRAAVQGPQWFEEPADDDVYLPGDGELVSELMGGSTEASPELQPISLSVFHGGVHHSPHPVLLGWEHGCPLGASLQRVDELLGGEIATRHRLGVLPGRLGSMVPVDNPVPDMLPPAVLVMGLGAPGSLTARGLQAATRDATVALLMERHKHGEIGPSKLATVALGSGDHGLVVEESVRAVVAGVIDANRDFGDEVAGDTYISELRLYEQYHDTATVIGHVLRGLSTDIPIALGTDVILRVEPRLTTVAGYLGARPYGESSRARALSIAVEPVSDRDLRFTLEGVASRADIAQTELTASTIEALLTDLRDSGTTYATGEVDAFFRRNVPSVYRDRIRTGRDILLLLRGRAANLPWELMTATETRGEGAPLEPAVVRQGFVRQLGVAVTRREKALSDKRRVAIIGNPPSDGLADLPAAAAEAEAVAALFASADDLDVVAAIETDTRPALDAITLDGGAMVLHVAAHGELTDRGTRILLEGSRALSSDIVQNLDFVPRLVFLNCCYGGIVGGNGDADFHRAPEFAAQIALAFIESGVQAVVAAGWEVDDAAAATFAVRFYESMLSGARLMRAARAARALTFTQHPEVNTCGAYQVWGDIELRLPLRSDARRGTDWAVSRSEILDQAVTLTGEARFRHETERQQLVPRVAALEATVEASLPEWQDAELWRKVGSVHLELGNISAAAKCFERAYQAGGLAQVQLRLFEDTCLVLARAGLMTDRQSVEALAKRVNDEIVRARGNQPEEIAAKLAMRLFGVAPTVRTARIVVDTCLHRALEHDGKTLRISATVEKALDFPAPTAEGGAPRERVFQLGLYCDRLLLDVIRKRKVGPRAAHAKTVLDGLSPVEAWDLRAAYALAEAHLASTLARGTNAARHDAVLAAYAGAQRDSASLRHAVRAHSRVVILCRLGAFTGADAKLLDSLERTLDKPSD